MQEQKWLKRADGCYQHGDDSVRYPVTADEAFYAFHLCQWLRVPPPDRIDQQVWSRRMQDGKPQYCMGWNFRWYDEALLAPLTPTSWYG